MGLKQRRQILPRFVGSKKEHAAVRQVVPSADANAILLSEFDSSRPPRNRPKPAMVVPWSDNRRRLSPGHDNDVGLGRANSNALVMNRTPCAVKCSGRWRKARS